MATVTKHINAPPAAVYEVLTDGWVLAMGSSAPHTSVLLTRRGHSPVAGCTTPSAPGHWCCVITPRAGGRAEQADANDGPRLAGR